MGRRPDTVTKPARVVIGAAACALLLLSVPLARQVDGLALVARAANIGGVVGRLADMYRVGVTERVIDMPLPGRPGHARVYAPTTTSRQTVLLVPGLHAAGIDEPRLAALATTLAEAGITVVTPDIQELARFEIVPGITDSIEASAAWLAGQSALTPRGRIGLMGINFSGGLALVAAGRASLRHRLLYVLSFGGHDDLPRVLEYLSTGRAPGTPAAAGVSPGMPAALPPPHDYGVAVVLLNVADHLVPSAQLPVFREALQRFLHASYLDVVDQPQGQREFAALRELARDLPEPSRTLLDHVNNRDVAQLGPLLLPHVATHASPSALSPSRSPLPQVSVFLLHGRADNVIPARESEHLADRLHGRVPVHLLVTNLISHVDAAQMPSPIDVARVSWFWGNLLSR